MKSEEEFGTRKSDYVKKVGGKFQCTNCGEKYKEEKDAIDCCQ